MIVLGAQDVRTRTSIFQGWYAAILMLSFGQENVSHSGLVSSMRSAHRFIPFPVP